MDPIDPAGAATIVFTEDSPASAEALACREAYFTELAERFVEGFDLALANASQDDDLVAPQGRFILGRLDGRPVACGGLRRLADETGEVKRMWVSPSVRGLGIAGRLLSDLERRAAQMGFRTLRLDTNRALVEAQAFYRGRGYREIGRYNDNPYAHHWFEKTL
ncbi:GNAT family N-acetyltransferase [Enterovirga rhinocerotis]|uniref:Acetyltransferase (GNAT) family protein n=1 Tax=Enterovirga rhinocerotis TaxID=1339210 RepID=A0A4R7BH25_9HYPH|nr:GNAT family N-acetyltransferase [Enterovirga rhinocerotis]TDR84570.1 acetyltransferase (GNAT) family protein [Enterovirga rhinocerotis]